MTLQGRTRRVAVACADDGAGLGALATSLVGVAVFVIVTGVAIRFAERRRVAS